MQQTEERIRQTKEQLTNQIADIRRQQGVLQADKARMTAESIQNYQAQVNQYKSGQQDFVRNLFVQQTNAENQLKQAMQKAQSTAESFRVMNLSQGGQTTPVRVGSRGSIQEFGGAPVNVGQNATLYETGVKKKEEEDPLTDLVNQLGG